MAKKLKICEFGEIPEGDMKNFKIGEQDIAVFKIGGKIYATTNVCTHEQCFLDENHTMHFDVIECTCHGSQFDVKTGDVITPPAVEGLKTYPVEIQGNDVVVEL